MSVKEHTDVPCFDACRPFYTKSFHPDSGLTPVRTGTVSLVCMTKEKDTDRDDLFGLYLVSRPLRTDRTRDLAFAAKEYDRYPEKKR